MGEISAASVGSVGALALVATVTVLGMLRGPYVAQASAGRRAVGAEQEDRPGASTSSRASAAPGSSGPTIGPGGVTVSPGTGAATSLPGLPPADVRTALAELDQKHRLGDTLGAIAALEQLAAADPAQLKQAGTMDKVIDLTQRVMLLPGDASDRMFTLLTQKSGTQGLDILLYLVTNKGGSRASKMAEQLLSAPENVERGSKAMQVAWALRQAKGCDDKKALFERAGKDGDRRARGILETLNRDCNRRGRDPSCCLHKDPALLAALAAMDARGVQ